jgi:Bacterial Ig-like domain (group 3)
MTDITIDTSALTDPQFVVPELGQQTIDGSAGAALSLPDGAYHVRHSTADPGGFAFSVAGGTLSFDPSFDGVAQGRGGTRLTLTGVTVTVDATQLNDSLRVSTYSGSPVRRDQAQPLRLLPAAQYLISGTLAGADLGLTLDPQGGIGLRQQDAGLATTAPGRLAITGLRISLDFTALDHDLYPLGFDNGGLFLSRSSVHELALLPAEGYGFQPGSGIVADFSYAVTRQGTVTVDPAEAGFAAAIDQTLLIQGYRLVLDATDADSNLVGIVQVPWPPQTPRTLEMTLIPCAGYIPQTDNGTFATGFTLGTDGTITVPPTATGYVVQQGTTPNPSQVNQEVSLRVSLQSDGDEPPAGGLVTFTVSDRLIASTPVGSDGTAELTTTFDAPGSIEIVVGYTGDEHRLPSSLIVPHLVQ